MRRPTYTPFNAKLYDEMVLKKRLIAPVKKTHSNIYQTGGNLDKFLYNRYHSSIACIYSVDLAFDSEIEKKSAKAFGGYSKFPELNPKLGEIGVLNKYDNYLYCLFARENWWERSCYEILEKCILKMKYHALENNVKSIYTARIGAIKNEGLNWFEVANILNEIFKETDIYITSYSLSDKHYNVYDCRVEPKIDNVESSF